MGGWMPGATRMPGRNAGYRAGRVSRQSVVCHYCVPESAEILTKRGWLHHSELINGEPVMVFDPQTHGMRWEPLEDVATFDFDGELWTYERRGGHKFRFTREHRWPYEVRTGLPESKGQRGIAAAHELNTRHAIPLTGEFQTENYSLLSPRLAAILGWIVTDGTSGWKGNHFGARVAQSPSKHLAEIIELLGTQPNKPNPRTGVTYVPVNLEDRKAITKHYHDKDDLPGLVTQLDREAAEAMWQAMYDAEGCDAVNGSKGFSQNPGPVRDAFQILCYMTGRSLWLGNDTDHYLRTTRYLHIKEGVGREQYKGTVWCPITPTGTWIMRQGGAVLPTGNTVGRNSAGIGVQGYFQFLVRRNGEIVQFAESDAVCWHAGNWNSRGPGIEVEYHEGYDGSHPGNIFTPAQLAACGRVVRWLHESDGYPLAFHDGGRVASHRGFITHRSLIQTGDAHHDYWSHDQWERMVGGAPAPEPPKRKRKFMVKIVAEPQAGIKAHWRSLPAGIVLDPVKLLLVLHQGWCEMYTVEYERGSAGLWASGENPTAGLGRTIPAR